MRPHGRQGMSVVGRSLLGTTVIAPSINTTCVHTSHTQTHKPHVHHWYLTVDSWSPWTPAQVSLITGCDGFDAERLSHLQRFPMSRRQRCFQKPFLFLFVVLSSLQWTTALFSGTAFNYEGQEPDGLVHMLQLKKLGFIHCLLSPFLYLRLSLETSRNKKRFKNEDVCMHIYQGTETASRGNCTNSLIYYKISTHRKTQENFYTFIFGKGTGVSDTK